MKERKIIEFSIFGLTFTLDTMRWLSLAFRCWLGLSLLLLICTVFFDYEMTGADLPGGFIFGALLGYFFHVILD